jgi:GNAT superfamily N-acetyltransferase
MIPLDSGELGRLAESIGDGPFTVSAYFFLRRGTCQAYVDATQQPRYGAIVPHTPCPEVYTFGAADLPPAEAQRLGTFLAGLKRAGGYLVPANLVQPIRAGRRIVAEVEGLCFTYRPLPPGLKIWRPEMARPLTPADGALLAALPGEAAFLYENYGSPAALLAEGLAFGVVCRGQLVSLAASLALTDRHCDVGAYTLPRQRHRGYATDCVEALLDHLLARGLRPLWRIGIKQKVAIYFAEKLGMVEIGADGQEVYLQACPEVAR